MSQQTSRLVVRFGFFLQHNRSQYPCARRAFPFRSDRNLNPWPDISQLPLCATFLMLLALECFAIASAKRPQNLDRQCLPSLLCSAKSWWQYSGLACAWLTTYSTAGRPGRGQLNAGSIERVDGVAVRQSVAETRVFVEMLSESRRCRKEEFAVQCAARQYLTFGFGSEQAWSGSTGGRFGQRVEMPQNGCINIWCGYCPRPPRHRFPFWQISDWVNLKFMK